MDDDSDQPVARRVATTYGLVAGVLFVWGLSWAAGDFAQCASAEDLLADAMWAFVGVVLALIASIVASVYLTASQGWLAGLGFAVLLVVTTGIAAGLGGWVAEVITGCEGATASAGAVLAMVGAIGAIAGWVVGAVVHWTRHRGEVDA